MGKKDKFERIVTVGKVVGNAFSVCSFHRKFVEKCFRPFSAGLIEEGVYKQLSLETAQYTTDLRMKVEE